MANTVEIVRNANNKLFGIERAASDEYENTIIDTWNKYNAIWESPDKLTTKIREAIEKRKNSGGKTFITGYVQTVLRDYAYTPSEEVKELYETLKAANDKWEVTCRTARDEFQSVVTLDILVDYHRSMNAGQVIYDDDNY